MFINQQNHAWKVIMGKPSGSNAIRELRKKLESSECPETYAQAINQLLICLESLSPDNKKHKPSSNVIHPSFNKSLAYFMSGVLPKHLPAYAESAATSALGSSFLAGYVISSAIYYVVLALINSINSEDVGKASKDLEKHINQNETDNAMRRSATFLVLLMLQPAVRIILFVLQTFGKGENANKDSIRSSLEQHIPRAVGYTETFMHLVIGTASAQMFQHITG